jgi:ABC-2 type transport system permease protein
VDHEDDGEVSAFAELRDSRELLVNLTLREIRGKYKRTLLGQGWSLLNPIASLLVFTAVFGLVLRIEVPPGDPSGLDVFALWLACGLLAWNFFTNSVISGMGSLVGDANLIKKVYFPRETLVISTVASWVVTFLIELLVLVTALLIFGGRPMVWVPVVAAFVAMLAMFALGVALLLSVANVYFRDTQHFVGILMQVWFYATPIVYPYHLVEDAAESLEAKGVDIPIEFLYRLNPLERFVAAFRALLYDNRWPALGDAVYCLGSGVAALAVGYWVFRRYQGRLAEEL